MSDRRGILDDALDSTQVDGAFAGQLFAVVDAFESSVALRRAVTDPAASEQARTGLVHAVLDGKVPGTVVDFVGSAATQRWSSGRSFVDALEREAVRAQLRAADDDGTLDDTEDQLFRFGRLVDANPDLRNAIADRVVPVSIRQELVGTLLDSRATSSAALLAERAVLAKDRSFERTIESYVDLAAAQKDRVVATVRVARPLEGGQRDRLRDALARQAGRPVVIQEIVEPGLLGGVRVELGDEVVEGTVAAKLDDARRLFGQG